MITRSSSSSSSTSSGLIDSTSNRTENEKRRRSTVTNEDDEQSLQRNPSGHISQAKPLKKRWLAHHHVDQEQQSTRCSSQDSLSTSINELIREYNFQDWQTITVLVQISNQPTIEYLSGTIVQIHSNGCLTVVPSMINSDLYSNSFEIDVWKNHFSILSDNAPPIRELTPGKHILFRQQKVDPTNNFKYFIYQSGTILQRTADAKFNILTDEQQEINSIPRQSIRLFLPPWHDEIPIDWNAALLASNLFKSTNSIEFPQQQNSIRSPSPRESSLSSNDSFQSNSTKETTKDVHLSTDRKDSSSIDVPTTIYNQVVYHKGDVMTSSQSQIRKKFNGKQWRRLCSKDGCPRESQRRGLCSRHLSQKGRQEHCAQTTLSFDRIHSQPSILPLTTNQNPTSTSNIQHGYYSAPQSRTTTPLLISQHSPRFILQSNQFDNEEFHSNGYSSTPRLTTSDIQLNDLSQVHPIRTVNWPDLLPKINLHIDTNRFQSIPTDENKDEDQHGNSYSGDQSSSSPNDSNHFNENPPENNSNEKSSQPAKEKEKDKEKEKEKEKHVRRPMNAFMLFSQEQRAKIHLANPNRDNRNVSKILGEKWYSLSSQEQESYKIRAKQLRNEHFKQNPSFKWSNSHLNKSNSSNSILSNPKDEQEHCRRSARLQSQSQSNQQDKTVSPSCDDRLQAFAQICTHMPKLNEQSSNQHFSPIAKATIANNSSSTDLITPVPIHPTSNSNSTSTSTSTSTSNENHSEIENNFVGTIEFHQTAFRAHSSLSMNEEILREKVSSERTSPELIDEQNPSNSSEDEPMRAMLLKLIHQRKANLTLEQQLKDLQSTQKGSSTIDSRSPTSTNYSLNSNESNQQQRTFFLLSSQNPFIPSSSSSSSSRLSHSTGYSSGSSSSSIDSHSTVLSAFSSRSNSSLSERSKTSPIPMKTNLFHYLPPINEIQHQLTSNIDEDLTLKDSSPLPSTSEQVKTNSKRKKFPSTIQSIERPTTRSRSISERRGSINSSINSNNESSAIVTRKRKSSIVQDLNGIETKKTHVDFIHQLEEMKNQFLKSNSTRPMINSSYSNNQTINKNQLTSRIKVIDFLKDQLYPTDAAISSFQMSNQDLFPTKRLLNQRIREIRQKLMSQIHHQQHQQDQQRGEHEREREREQLNTCRDS